MSRNTQIGYGSASQGPFAPERLLTGASLPGSSIKDCEIRGLKEGMSRILFESLPLTFKDGVRTTRDLGVRDLWIESLCIIQDSDNPSDLHDGQDLFCLR